MLGNRVSDQLAPGFDSAGLQMDTVVGFVPSAPARVMAYTNSICSAVGACCTAVDFDPGKVAVRHHPHRAHRSSVLSAIPMFLSCVRLGFAAAVSGSARALTLP